ncbi:MAG: glucarate dehydratase [Sphingobacteriales bacterium 17-39-43]|uniref:enolase C-terminal domain-like protein n=1 Tax=Daejeonella sp. TaxID=2805397 RepID=UPI000BCD6792|nr:enolase C-terminal domain-like protein [Daejeonella sp.]OYY04000.1 MAG: glucarate dehydratase [Sphingobacteriia bacterium 35-40-5]OYZ32466.1 MAG: glucarate dehydratase [Sphingobacteriales bacterium 16-39-50]OZA25829.1 MAG: glucarate dehydratase [Sphingobacteriales bacterium 17-39-43]HQS04189.1 enolase C-terminal domain-like protein [Daejeonella sp.]HQS51425.1 enolase C-terminal domain-like protein [Daejeonella sp.]
MLRQKGPRIKDIVITPIAIVDPPLLNAAGLHAPYALRIILEIITDDQISGISEIPGTSDIEQALYEAKELLIGKDVFQLNQIRTVLTERFGSESPLARGETPWDQRKLVHIFSSVEVACMDIMGKVLGRPIVDLLGGKMRESVPFSAYLFYKYEGAGGEFGFNLNPNAEGWEAAKQKQAINPEEIVFQARAMCKEFGFKSIKLKGGVFEPRIEVDTILALFEEFGPSVPLRFDPNAIWALDTAIQYGKELEGVLEYLEDPVRGQENMAAVRKVLKTPLATNMCTTSFEEIPASIKIGSEDIILSDHHFWGGLKASITLSGICETFGRDLSMHSNSHLGISLAAMVHLGAALPKMPYALDTHYPWQSDEVILGGRIKFTEGSVAVPDEPGLGVELDKVALARLHQNYINCGLKKRNDEIEMQKKVPGWKFQSTRW